MEYNLFKSDGGGNRLVQKWVVWILLFCIVLPACSPVTPPASPEVTPAASRIALPDVAVPGVKTPPAAATGYPIEPTFPDGAKVPVTPTVAGGMATAYPGEQTQMPSTTKAAYPPPSGRSPVYIDKIDHRLTDSLPPKILITVTGSKPTPCHEVMYELAAPDKALQVVINVYSQSTPGKICAQVLAPFTLEILAGPYAKGIYRLRLNEKDLGEITIP